METEDLYKLNERLQEQAKLQQNIALLESVAKKKMTREAISRYGALKLTRPETALQAILIVAQAVEQGMQEVIDDEKFKEILRQIARKK